MRSTNEWRHVDFNDCLDIRFYRKALDWSGGVYDIDIFTNSGYV
jgi:hypothetical protein